MFDAGLPGRQPYENTANSFTTHRPPLTIFTISKRAFDILVGLALLGLAIVVGTFLFVLNIFYNKGPLFFVQTRMGRDCAPFEMIKFRTMTEAGKVTRSAECHLETDRITRLGCILRKFRLDELPQAINVLKGEMSLIGPRPDVYDHAKHFINEVPGYRDRHVVRPGISGHAQTEIGYVQGSDATRAKVAADLHYIRNMGFGMDTKIAIRTLAVIFGRGGM